MWKITNTATLDWECPSNACTSYMPALQLWLRSCREVLGCPWLLDACFAFMAGCCVTKIRANLQLVLDHHARTEHTGRRGKSSTTKPACSGHLHPRLPSCRCKSARTPINQYGRRDEKKYPCLAGNRTTLNGSVIILQRYPSPQRDGRSRSRIPVGVKFSAPVQIGPGTHPASVQWVHSPFPGVNRQGSGFLTTSSVDVKDRVQLHLYSSSEPSWPVLGWTFLLQKMKSLNKNSVIPP
jgi:hypothetical protein